MKILFTLVATAAALIGHSTIEPAAAQSSEDAVCFFEHSNFRGDRVCAPIGEQVDALHGFNDIISSISVQPGARVRVCTDSDLNGRCKTFDKDTRSVGDRFNDRITSYHVTRGKVASVPKRQAANSVCFFEHANHRGRRICADAGEVVRQVPANWNDSISSLRIRGEVAVQVCENSRLRGRCREFDKDTAFVGDRWNDRISSYRVSELAVAEKPQARNSICFYEHAKYRGRRFCATAGEANRRIGQDWNDAISSLKVRGAVAVQVCEKARFGGRCREFAKDSEFVGDRWNDRISSFRVVSTDNEDVAGNQPQKPLAKNRACFYPKPNFGGRALCVPAGDVRNRLPDRWNDRISSVKIHGDTSVTVCTRRGLGGRCQKITRDVAYVGDRWDDRISSLRTRIERVGVHPVKPGQVCFYTESHFRGAEFCTTRVGFPQRMPNAANNRTSSIRVPRGAIVLMCDGKRMNKGCIRVDRHVEYVGDQWNNRISAFDIKTNGIVLGEPAEPLDGDGQADARGAVCFYTKANYKGRHFCVNPGDDSRQLSQRWNDRISSVRIARDVAVKVCQNFKYAGRCKIFEQDTVYVGDRWNDRISSFQVRTSDVIDTITNGKKPNNGIVQHPSDQICFFKQKKWKGVRLCAGSGSSVPRMPDGWNNNIRGLRNYGRAILQICDKPRFGGQCRVIDNSNKSLGPWSNRVSSFKIWSK